MITPETVLERNSVYTRWRELIEHEHLPEAEAESRVSESLGVPPDFVNDGIFAGELTSCEIRYREAAGAEYRARTLRNEMIRQALQRGWTHADIAVAMALTRSRVGQIALSLVSNAERG